MKKMIFSYFDLPHKWFELMFKNILKIAIFSDFAYEPILFVICF